MKALSTAALALYAACAPGLRTGTAAGPVTDASIVAAPAIHRRTFSVPEPPGFTRAVERGSRTRRGQPGPNYWQQYTRYELTASLDTGTKQLAGSGRIRYYNRSPDALPRLAVHLYQNLYAATAVRNRTVSITGGMALSRVMARNAVLTPLASTDTLGRGYRVDGTIAWLQLAEPVAPGDSIVLEFSWSFTVPPTAGSPRMGQDGEVFHLAYWYPQLAVYDDINGWQADQYMGTAEFYMGYADYDVTLRVPSGWLVVATGELANPQAVLSVPTQRRLASVRSDTGIVHIVREEDRGAARATAAGGGDGTLTWRFTAREVRDFAWTTSSRYVWDAASVVVGDVNGDGASESALVHALYRPQMKEWRQTARYARHAIGFLSRFLWPYPYPHMTAVEGLAVGRGMEFPMTTFIAGPRRDSVSMQTVTIHEIGHMWFPMMVGSDEKRNMWQDEGLTSFNDLQGSIDFFPGIHRDTLAGLTYYRTARERNELEIMRHGDHYMRDTSRRVAAYDKPMVVLHALRGLLGEELFIRAYREYGRRWTNRHPQPGDLFNTFNDVSGRDLSWFWRTWFFETWTLDQAIAGVERSGDELLVTVEDRGTAPMPVHVLVTRRNGGTTRLETPVDLWLAGQTSATIRVPDAASVAKIEIDPEKFFPDLDRTNNTWTAP